MSVCLWIIVLCLVQWSTCWSDNRQREFKPGFQFGASTLAYNIEGAWNEDGKGESVWDHMYHSHTPHSIRGGDTAADSYHKYKEDVKLLAKLGVHFYRFSISWTRVMPNGDNVNEKGLKYYDKLIDELLKHNIKPYVCMHDFDMPYALHKKGGWINPQMITWFKDYAELLFNRYGHKVEAWTTINRPNSCFQLYQTNSGFANMKTGVHDYICTRNVLLAHASVYRIYEKKYKKKFNGYVGFSMDINWLDPRISKDPDHERATDLERAFRIGLFLDPIYSKTGDFPEAVKNYVAAKSLKEGLTKSRLPKFNRTEINMMKGAADFISMNHYTTFLISPDDSGQSPYEHPVVDSFGDQWPTTNSVWRSAPYGIYKVCWYLNQNYGYPTIVIAENGVPTTSGLEDTTRVDYYKEYLKTLLFAIEDGANIKGYSAWSLIDGFEGFKEHERFGLFEVSQDSENKKRTPRDSAFFYKNVIETRVVDANWKFKGKSRKMKMSARSMKAKKEEDKEAAKLEDKKNVDAKVKENENLIDSNDLEEKAKIVGDDKCSEESKKCEAKRDLKDKVDDNKEKSDSVKDDKSANAKRKAKNGKANAKSKTNERAKKDGQTPKSNFKKDKFYSKEEEDSEPKFILEGAFKMKHNKEGKIIKPEHNPYKVNPDENIEKLEKKLKNKVLKTVSFVYEPGNENLKRNREEL